MSNYLILSHRLRKGPGKGVQTILSGHHQTQYENDLNPGQKCCHHDYIPTHANYFLDLRFFSIWKKLTRHYRVLSKCTEQYNTCYTTVVVSLTDDLFLELDVCLSRTVSCGFGKLKTCIYQHIHLQFIECFLGWTFSSKMTTSMSSGMHGHIASLSRLWCNSA